MIALDTNVLYRFLVEDLQSPDQTAAARVVVARAEAAGDQILVPLVVLVETTWVLSKAGAPRETISDVVEGLLGNVAFTLDGRPLVEVALGRYRSGAAGFADYVILATSQTSGAATLYSFDKKLRRARGVERPIA